MLSIQCKPYYIVFSYTTLTSTSLLKVKRAFQFTLFSLTFALLAWKAVLPCHVAISVCYISQVVCEINRAIFSGSMNPLCNLALISHSRDHLLRALPQSCPSVALWTIKPSILDTFLGFLGQTPVSINRNYASYGAGARVLKGYTSQTHGLPPPSFLGSLSQSIFGYNPQYADINGAGIFLEEDMGVGECWRFSGGFGHIAVNLSEAVFISHITMDYASPSLLSEHEIASSPKSMALWALLSPMDEDKPEHRTSTRPLTDFKIRIYGEVDNFPVSSRLFHLLDFRYDVSKQPTKQTFQIPFRMHFPTGTVVLEIQSNGGSDTTCIYWIGIYGMPATVEKQF